jgi:hypothetical protein
MVYIKFNGSSKKIVHYKGMGALTLCGIQDGEFEELDERPYKFETCQHCKNTYHRMRSEGFHPFKKIDE